MTSVLSSERSERVVKISSKFARKYPAFYLGIFLLLGAAQCLHPHLLYFLIGAPLLLPIRRASLLCVIAFASSWLLCTLHLPSTTLDEPLHGTGTFSITSIKKSKSPFSPSLIYTGTLDSFTSDNGDQLPSLPCRLYQPLHAHRPPATTPYTITGILQEKDSFFLLKPDKGAWKKSPSPYFIPLAEWRYLAKQKLQRHLHHQIKSSKAARFIGALLTGDVDDQSLSLDFSRLGLQHILAISGFHFALIAGLLSALFQLFFSPRLSTILLLIFITGYFLFLGDAPSIQRAWAAIALFLIGQLIKCSISPINALGAGLCCEILLDPLSVQNLGFQLSFLCTLALLLLYPLVSKAIEWLLPIRSFADVKAMPRLDQHGYIACAGVRQALAVILAIHIASLPVLLFYFHRFPLLSLVYNLFFPLGVSISLLLASIALILTPLPGISPLLHAFNGYWTRGLLLLTEHPPAYFDVVLRYSGLSFEMVVIYLALLLGIAIHLKERNAARFGHAAMGYSPAACMRALRKTTPSS